LASVAVEPAVEQNSPARYVVPAGGAVVGAVAGAVVAGAIVGAVVATVVGAVVGAVVATVVLVAVVLELLLPSVLALELQAPNATAPTHINTRNGRSLNMPSLSPSFGPARMVAGG
jgi:hypothetical protein